MENSPKFQEILPSPKSHSSNSSCSSTTNINGLHRPSPPASQPSPPPMTRSELNSPHPTTFVQADTSSFKQVVQMLTGSTETVRHSSRPEPVRNPIPAMKTGLKKDKSTSKLYERRNNLKDFKISPLGPGLVNTRPTSFSGYLGSPRMRNAVLSPSILDFPSLMLSPATPLIPDPFNRSPNAGVSANNLSTATEDKAIKEKGFYFHPSPANTPKDLEPRLLPLFPVTSPKIAGAADS